MEDTAIGGLACGLVFGTLVGALILIAACNVYNKWPGSPGAVPAPSLGKAALITLVTTLVNLVVAVVIGTAATQIAGRYLVGGAISVPASFLVMAGMLTALLPTSLSKACRVTLIYIVVLIVIPVVVITVVIMLLFATGMWRGH